MWNQTLCLSVNPQFGISGEEQIRMFHAAGFDGYFLPWDEGVDLSSCVALGNELGMILQSIHAPFTKAADMWGDDEQKGRIALDELLACLADCVRFGAPIMVVHAFIGFEDHNPTTIGIERFGKLVKAAEDAGVKLAFENTEGEEYLAALLDAFKDSPNVGFCWDTGHEMCYNHSQDLLALYGDRLIATHINDNLGIRDPQGRITFIDDLHLLPFDGIADWDDIAARLDRCGYKGIMTFELNTLSKPGRHENDKYAQMPVQQYIAECYVRACRVAARRKL